MGSASEKALTAAVEKFLGLADACTSKKIRALLTTKAAASLRAALRGSKS